LYNGSPVGTAARAGDAQTSRLERRAGGRRYFLYGTVTVTTFPSMPVAVAMMPGVLVFRTLNGTLSRD
jgi:hypothetical protein